MNSHINHTDEIDIREILSILQKGKKTIVYGSLIGTLLLIGVLLLWPKSYESKAVLSLGTINTKSIGINIPMFRSFKSVYSSPNMFADYLVSVDSSSDWIVHSQLIEDNAIPIYGYDEKTAVSTDANTVLGLELMCAAHTPEMAMERVMLLGRYLETVMLNMQIWDYYEIARGLATTGIAKNNSSILQSKFKIENLKEKGELLESKFIVSQALKSSFDAQFVQVDEVTEKYLSPQQQLVSVKVSIKNYEIGVRRYERKLRMNQAALQYLSTIEADFDEGKQFLFNTQLLDRLSAQLELFFKELKKSDAGDEAYYEIKGKFNEFYNLRSAQYKFISVPTLNRDWVQPRILLTSFIGFIALVLLFSLRALFRAWWSTN